MDAEGSPETSVTIHKTINSMFTAMPNPTIQPKCHLEKGLHLLEFLCVLDRASL